jgi:ribA/ribD-fused uncharacterized protein
MDNYVFFWGEKEKFGFMSNFYPCKFTVGTNTFNCSEQYFMKMKQEVFDNSNHALGEKIMNETNPIKIKKLGREVSNYNEQVWNQQRYKHMYNGNYLKYSQNPELKNQLLATGSKILVEASPYDKIWGIGWTKVSALANINSWGQNLLGKVLMELRAKLSV